MASLVAAGAEILLLAAVVFLGGEFKDFDGINIHSVRIMGGFGEVGV